MNERLGTNLISSNSDVKLTKLVVDTTIIKSEDRAKAILSLLLLLEHRDHWNSKDSYTVDWMDDSTIKWCITTVNNDITIINTNMYKKLLCFGNKESCMYFLESFRELIDSAKDLI